MSATSLKIRHSEMACMVRPIGLLFGMEDTFPWALIQAINSRPEKGVFAEPVSLSYLKDSSGEDYDLILGRAARWGLDGKLIDFGKKAEVSTEALLSELLEFVESSRGATF